MKQILMILVFLVLLQSVFAVSGITLTSPEKSFFLEENTSLNAVFEISNQSGQKICLNASAETTPNELEVIIASEEFCLNDTEKTNITLTLVASEETDSGNYTVDLNVVHDFGSESHSLNVFVGQEPEISLSDNPESEYCNNKTIVIPITVTNNSSGTKNIKLEPSSAGFLPSLEKYSVNLDAGESRELDLTIHTNAGTFEGTFEYAITAITGTQVSIQKFEFEIEYCEPDPFIPSGFELEVPSNCINIVPGKEKSTSFSIENIGNSNIKVWFSVVSPSGLDIELGEDSPITLKKDDTETVPVTIDVPSGIKEGVYLVSVSASSLSSTKTGTICLVIGNPFEMEIIPNNVSIEADQAFGIAISLKNNWNTSQTVSLSVSDSEADTSVSFSRSSVHLSKFEEETIIVTINTDEDIELGGHSIEFKARNSNATIKQRLFFSVIPKQPIPPTPPEPQEEAVIELLSYPVFIDLNSTQGKEVVFVLLNDSNETLEDISIVLVGLPQEVSFIRPPLFSLEAHSIVSVRGLVVLQEQPAESKEYSLSLITSNQDYKNTKTVRMHITGTEEAEAKKQTVFDSFITGLWGLGKSFSWIIMLIVIVIIAVLLVAWNKEQSTYLEHRKKWRRFSGKYP